MVSPFPCPDDETLERYLLGRVPEVQAVQVERHVAGCGSCLDRLQALPAEDLYVTAMRSQAGARPLPANPAVVALMERLNHLRPPAPAAYFAPTPPTDPEGTGATSANLPDVSALLAPPQAADELGRLGGYRVLEVLGCGGMGIVFRAEDVQLGRAVALKVMRPELGASGSALPRFLREARAMAAIEHEHIAAIYQAGEERGVPFLAMQFLRGETLEARLRRAGRLSPGEVLRIGREVAEGLAAAHERGLVHRDVKPSNIWLEDDPLTPPPPLPRRGEGEKDKPQLPPLSSVGEGGGGVRGGRVKLLDFGLARQVRDSAHVTREGAIVGTPAYMSPEQARGAALDGRSDLFSLGCVLYRLCTGVVPFAGSDVVATLVAVATEPAAPPRQLNPEVPPRLSALIEQLLAKQPGDRPASASAVADALAALERDPEGAAPLPAPPRRRPLAVVVGALAVLVPAIAGFYLASRGGPQPEVKPGELRRLEGHTDLVDCVAFLPDGRRALSGGWDRTVRLWDLDTGRQVLQFPHAAAVHCLAVSPDGRLVLAAGGTRRQKEGAQPGDYDIHLWETDKGKEVTQFSGHRDKVTGLAFLPGGSEFLSLSWDGTLRRWDRETGKQLAVLEKDVGPLRSLALMPGGKQAVSGSATGIVRLWDLAACESLSSFRAGSEPVDCLAVTPDGERILAGGTDRVVRIWDVKSGKVVGHLTGHAERVWSVAVSPDGRRALTGSMDRTLRLWDLQTGEELHVFTGHEKGVQGAVFSPDGRRALSASSDRTVRLWQLP
jgi:serine/threonine protein kinase